MRRLLTAQFGWVLAAELLAFWASWRWYAGRVAADQEDLWGVFALLTAIVFTLRHPATRPILRAPLLLPGILMLAYVLVYHETFPLLRALLAMTALAATVSAFRFGTRLHPGLCGLAVLSLPVIPSLQFYLGYPLRMMVTGVTVQLLRLSGFLIHAEGTALRWGHDLVVVDAPCSGVKMLWAGCFLACALVCLFDFSWQKTLLALLGTLGIVLLGNALRAAALFIPESGVINLPAWSHDGIGIIVFILTTVAITAVLQLMQRRSLCVE